MSSVAFSVVTPSSSTLFVELSLCVFRVGVCWVTVLSAHSCVPCFMFSQVQVRHRTILLVHIGRSHIATYQEFLVSKLLIFISVNYAIYLC